MRVEAKAAFERIVAGLKPEDWQTQAAAIQDAEGPISHERRSPRDFIKNWYVLKNTVSVEGSEALEVAISVFEDANGDKFYNLNHDITETQRGRGG